MVKPALMGKRTLETNQHAPLTTNKGKNNVPKAGNKTGEHRTIAFVPKLLKNLLRKRKVSVTAAEDAVPEENAPTPQELDPRTARYPLDLLVDDHSTASTSSINSFTISSNSSSSSSSSSLLVELGGSEDLPPEDLPPEDLVNIDPFDVAGVTIRDLREGQSSIPEVGVTAPAIDSLSSSSSSSSECPYYGGGGFPNALDDLQIRETHRFTTILPYLIRLHSIAEVDETSTVADDGSSLISVGLECILEEDDSVTNEISLSQWRQTEGHEAPVLDLEIRQQTDVSLSDLDEKSVGDYIVRDDPWSAAKRGDVKAIQQLADEGSIDWTLEDDFQSTPLYYACHSGAAAGQSGLSTVRLLLNLWPGQIPPGVLSRCRQNAINQDVTKLLDARAYLSELESLSVSTTSNEESMWNDIFDDDSDSWGSGILRALVFSEESD